MRKYKYKPKIVLITPVFLRKYSAPAVRWRAFVTGLRQRYDIVVVEFPDDIGPWRYRVVKSKISNIVVYSFYKQSSYRGSFLRKIYSLLPRLFKKNYLFLYKMLYNDLVDKVLKIIKLELPNAVIASVPPFHSAILAYIASLEFDLPYIVDIRDLVEYYYYYIHMKKKILNKRLAWKYIVYRSYIDAIKNSRLLTTVTPVFMKFLREMYGVRIELIPNGVTKVIEKPRNYRSRKKQIMFIEASNGEFSSGLGVKTIVETWSKLFSKQVIDPEYRLLIVGGVVDNIALDGLKKIRLIRRLPYNRVLEELSNSMGSIIWCLNSKNPAYLGSVPVKFYDSIGTGTPVIACGPNSYLSILVNNYNLGEYSINTCSNGSFEEAIINFINNVESGAYDEENIVSISKKFLRENYVNKLSLLINSIV